MREERPDPSTDQLPSLDSVSDFTGEASQRPPGSAVLQKANEERTSEGKVAGSHTTEAAIPTSVMRDQGYVDPAGTYSDYSSYDTPTIIQIAETGDRRALLEAAKRGSIPFERRQQYALLAAEQGYTSALFRVGMAGLIAPPPGVESSKTIDLPDPVTAVALLITAKELGDSGANQGEVWDFVIDRVSEEEMQAAELKARKIIHDLTVR